MKGRNGILLFVPQDKGLLEDRKWRLKGVEEGTIILLAFSWNLMVIYLSSL